MRKKCAICLRGKCLDIYFDSKNNKLKKINYKKGIKSLYKNIIYENPEIDFDFYLHGWISDLSYVKKIINDYKPKKYILEKQKKFINDFKYINNYSEILKERYKHLDKKDSYNYNSIHFRNYFQNIFSYAYSISKVIELIDEEIDYDYILHLRYDIYINEKIKLNILNDNKIYLNNVKKNYSKLFYGDFIYFSSKKKGIFFKFFYTFLKNKIFNNNEYKIWVNEIIKNKKKNEKGRYEHGIYSNQMIYAYFITKNFIQFKDIVQEFNVCLVKV